MGRIIAVANQKGGVGKTTTAINLSACLAEKGMKVLTIDIDPQGNTTSGLGINKAELEHNVYQMIIDECSVEKCMYQSIVDGLFVLPSDVNLAGAEIELIGIENKEYILRDKVESIKDFFDYIIIDCPPSLNILTVNALTTADKVLVPIQCEYYALEGLSQLIHTINLVKQRLNEKLEIEGVVFTMYDARTNLSLQVVENVRSNLNQNIYKAIIPRNVRLAEAPSHGLPISMYDPKSAGADAYRDLADEILKQDGVDSVFLQEIVSKDQREEKQKEQSQKDVKQTDTKQKNVKQKDIKQKDIKQKDMKQKDIKQKDQKQKENYGKRAEGKLENRKDAKKPRFFGRKE